jgi:DNA-binding NarL/FixJ family response regulator
MWPNGRATAAIERAPMSDIAVVSASPLLAEGLAGALAGVTDWRVTIHPAPTAADALVLHVRDAAQAVAWCTALPALQPCVLLGDDLREVARLSAAGSRPLALLSPELSPARLRAAVAAVLQGLSVRAADDAATALDSHRAPGLLAAPDHEPLTPRELEVFELLGKGLSNPDIGGVLGISAHTAKYHVGQILAKVGATTRAEAVRTGLQLGVIGL